ncbi:hypothetical protein NL676_023916 [Syzygium grande]|nr:hypothetical protein NL676_023916 [Syzygium grande]
MPCSSIWTTNLLRLFQVASPTKSLDQDGIAVLIGDKTEQLQLLVQSDGGSGMAAVDQAVEEEITGGDAGNEGAPLEAEQGIDSIVEEASPNIGPDEEIDRAKQERRAAQQKKGIEQGRNSRALRGMGGGDEAGEDEIEAGAGGGGGEDGDEGGISGRVEREATGIQVKKEGEGEVGVRVGVALKLVRRVGGGGGSGRVGRVGVEETCGGREELGFGEGGERRREELLLGAPYDNCRGGDPRPHHRHQCLKIENEHRGEYGTWRSQGRHRWLLPWKALRKEPSELYFGPQTAQTQGMPLVETLIANGGERPSSH